MVRKYDRNAKPPELTNVRTFTHHKQSYAWVGERSGTAYAICNLAARGVYIGKAVRSTYIARWQGHLLKLKRGTHHSPLLQSAWNSHPSSDFVFVTLPLRGEYDERLWYAYYKNEGWTMYNAHPLA